MSSPRFFDNRLRLMHLVIGTLGMAVFLGSGQYMHWVHGHLQGMPDGPRMLYRSSHIYLLWSSLLNILLGCYLVQLRHRALRVAQVLASLCLLAGPFLLAASFFTESNSHALARPLARYAIYLALAGVLTHAICKVAAPADKGKA
jgi:hypothetical protein